MDQIDDPSTATELVIESDGELVCTINRNGGFWFAYTPYDNADGVTNHAWSLFTYEIVAYPGRTLVQRPHLVEPSTDDRWPVNQFTTEFVEAMCRAYVSDAWELEHRSESPFAGGLCLSYDASGHAPLDRGDSGFDGWLHCPECGSSRVDEQYSNGRTIRSCVACGHSDSLLTGRATFR